MRHERDNDGWLMRREAEAPAYGSDRALFIQRTYLHLAGAILAFIALTYVLLNVMDPQPILRLLFSGGQMGWLVVLLAFMGVSYVAQSWARSNTSRTMQYMGLGLFVVAEAIIFLPLLYIAQHFYPGAIQQAAILTLAVFGGLTVTAFVSKKDFSFLAPILSIGFLLALGVIVAGILFGFTLGLFFCFAMVALVAGSILYETSNLRLYYNPDQYVAAALGLFASVALLFWYILQIVMSMQNRN